MTATPGSAVRHALRQVVDVDKRVALLLAWAGAAAAGLTIIGEDLDEHPHEHLGDVLAAHSNCKFTAPDRRVVQSFLLQHQLASISI